MKECIYCKEKLSDDMFYTYKKQIRSGKPKLSSECKKCSIARVTAMTMRLKIESINYLGGKCSKCDYNKNIKALDFHHVNSKDKDFSIAGTRYKTVNDIKDELDKCVILCSNCHREEHDNLWRSDDTINWELYNQILKEPLREKQNKACKKNNTFCVDCNVKINFSSTRCKECSSLNKEKIKWPSNSELEELISKLSMRKIGALLGVSDRAIAHRCDIRGIVRKK